MPAYRSRGDLLPRGRVLKDGSHVWRVGRAESPLAFPSVRPLPERRSGRFDDPLGEYSTLYCAGFQSVALRETLQHFRRDTATLAKLERLYGPGAVPPARVPADWRETRVLAPARIRLSEGAELAAYESPDLLRELEGGFAELLDSLGISNLDIPPLRSKDLTVSQLFGRSLYNRGFAGVVFHSSVPPGGVCVALFEKRGYLEAAGHPRPLTEPLSALRTVAREFKLDL